MKRMTLEQLVNKNCIFMALIFTVLFTSCQEEYVKVDEPDTLTAISANDSIADIILKVALLDGSFDNIIDQCSAISIQFPYSIRIKDETITISSPADVEMVKLDYFQFRNNISINFPVTVIYSDYSESVLNNKGELNQIQNDCNHNTDDDDIECIDFVYPFEMTLYNKAFQKARQITVRNDKKLYQVFKSIDDFIIEIDYPIEIELTDGNRLVINDNAELANAIAEAQMTCDENDKVDFSDEDYPYIDVFLKKEWDVLIYEDTAKEKALLSSCILHFKTKNKVQASLDNETFNGTWELVINKGQVLLKSEFDTDESPISLLNETWKIIKINTKIIEFETESDAEGHKKKMLLQASNNSN